MPSAGSERCGGCENVRPLFCLGWAPPNLSPWHGAEWAALPTMDLWARLIVNLLAGASRRRPKLGAL